MHVQPIWYLKHGGLLAFEALTRPAAGPRSVVDETLGW